jgi:hypothetical protein
VFYNTCFDHFDGSAGLDEDSILGLLKSYNVDVVKYGEFRGRLDEFLTTLHDEGIIQPSKDCKKPSVDDVKHYFGLTRRLDGKDVYEEYIKDRKEKGLDTFIDDE